MDGQAAAPTAGTEQTRVNSVNMETVLKSLVTNICYIQTKII